jgi:hypothetical protein
MEQVFTDGNMADVVRIGNRVRKQKSPWWNATRQVLNHLEQVEFRWSPRVLHEDEQFVELSFVPGETIEASLVGHDDPELLVTIGQRVRELHDALEGFELLPDTECVPWPVAPDQRLIVCHNDLSPWNTVMGGNTFQGFIDWDLVSVATREWDLAWVCWRFAPIYPGGGAPGFTARQQADRCRILLDAYGTDALDLHGFVDLIDMRMECGLESVEQLGAQGVTGFDRILASGMHLSAHDDRRWFNDHRRIYAEALEP